LKRLDLSALAHPPEEVGIPIPGRPVKVVGEVGWGMRQARGCRSCAFAVGAVANHAVGLEERLSAGNSRRIVPACAPSARICGRGWFPRVMLVVMPVISRRRSMRSFVVVSVLA
jgi:hypothetical protein